MQVKRKRKKKKEKNCFDFSLTKFSENYFNAKRKADNLNFARNQVEFYKEKVKIENTYENRDNLFRAENNLVQASIEYNKN